MTCEGRLVKLDLCRKAEDPMGTGLMIAIAFFMRIRDVSVKASVYTYVIFEVSEDDCIN